VQRDRDAGGQAERLSFAGVEARRDPNADAAQRYEVVGGAAQWSDGLG
jgi:hypothetical protein